VIKDALLRGYNVAWIFEDDVEFVEDPHQLTTLIKELSKIDPNWDILYTDLDSKNNQGISVPALDADFRPDRTFHYPLEHYLKRQPVTNDLMRLGQRYGMYSFLISRKGMKKIYQYFTHVYLWSAVDIDIHYIPTIREYSTTRDLVTIWCESPFSDTKQQQFSF
jgi:GR25 family glycosyltransferase involved in LPS biosynthesis